MEQYSHRNFLATKAFSCKSKDKKNRKEREKEETKQGKTFNVTRNRNKNRKSFVIAAIHNIENHTKKNRK